MNLNIKELKLGHNVQLGYFAQNQAEYLDGEITLLQTMEDAAADTNRMKVRDMLGSFFCLEEMMRKKVKVPQEVKETVLRYVNYCTAYQCVVDG
jgi:ATPase subunit of ABC transporter with duplicated ATPase domains